MEGAGVWGTGKDLSLNGSLGEITLPFEPRKETLTQ